MIKESGLRLKREKCTFMKDSVVYLGMKIDKEGISPVKEKISAILEAPNPTNTSELRAFLGMLNYYRKHLVNLPTVLEPLNILLRKEVKWEWGWRQSRAFETAKEMLTSATLLVHYDPPQPLIIACDASHYGLGAVLSLVTRLTMV